MRTMSIGHGTGSSPLARRSPSPYSLWCRAPIIAVRLSAPVYPAISATDATAVFFTFLLLVGHFGLGLAFNAAVANGAGLASASDRQQPVGSSQTTRDHFLDFLNVTSSHGCPLLHERLARDICALPVNWEKRERTQKMRSLRFRFCDSFLVFHAVGGPKCSDIDALPEADCVRCFEDLERRDLDAYAMYCQFEDALSRFDCRSEYSRHWKCKDCKDAYKNWVCSNTIPFYANKSLIPACSNYCHIVQNRCPYFLPEHENQYAGEASFICPEISVSPTPGYATSSLQLCHQPCRTSSNSQLYNDTNICVRPLDALSSTTSSPSSSSSVSSTHSASDGGTYSEHSVAGSNVSAVASDASRHTMTRHRVLLVILVTCHCLWMTDARRTLLSQTFYRATGLT